MRKDKTKAVELRKNGKSYNEIRELLGVPKSTLSDWLSEHEWSREIKTKLAKYAKDRSIVHLKTLNLIRGARLKKLYKNAEKEAVEEFEKLKFHPLFITGIAIYWGEGDRKSRGLVRIANIDPSMITLFVRFLLVVCAVPAQRVKAWLLLYPDLKESECKNFWIQQTGLSEENFNKSIVIRGKHRIKRIHFGVCNVGISSTYLKQKMIIWLSLLPQELLKMRYHD